MSREDDFRPLDWVAKQIPRTEAEQWWQGGFSLKEALRWRERFGAEEATTWCAAGVTNPAEARSWRIAGVSANSVGAWIDAGIGFAEASAWNEFGYELNEARQLKAEGKTPSESFRTRVQRMSGQPGRAQGSQSLMRQTTGSATPTSHPAHRFVEKLQARHAGGRLIHGYMQRQWLDDEALTWALEGIEASDAVTWKEFGIGPSDAAVLQKSGDSPAATIRAWWDAGVPPSEVGIWIGAGFTPHEASTQRALGITADHAAVLRALRELDSS